MSLKSTFLAFKKLHKLSKFFFVGGGDDLRKDDQVNAYLIWPDIVGVWK